MTHEHLVKLASKWLRNADHCGAVICGLVSAAGEQPDAIGWQSGRSTIVECKASRSDFLADAGKPWRRVPELALGDFRYYLAPAGLIRPDELPEYWGLVEVSNGNAFGDIVRRKVQAVRFERDAEGLRRELALLVSALRRMQTREFITIVPEESDQFLRWDVAVRPE